ncbi:MAG: phasin family protein [Burkholderiales bacterium]|nr:phasin family protein [Burkholderiales bacterium]
MTDTTKASPSTRKTTRPTTKTASTRAQTAKPAARRMTAAQKAASLDKAAKKATALGRKGVSSVLHQTRDASFKLIDSQRAIWLAGLGALANANATTGAKGEQAFEALVEAGANLEAQANLAIDTHVERLKNGIDGATTVLEQSIERFGGNLDTLVEQALDRLGFPKVETFNDLVERLTDLSKTLETRIRSTFGA